ncbi:hypothetical protein [Guyparkeria sp.]|uniref:hypothetical protein n=1 Tax=Guyparkeria sp. TaxID=2035736 RepID=UPI0039705C02
MTKFGQPGPGNYGKGFNQAPISPLEQRHYRVTVGQYSRSSNREVVGAGKMLP